MRRPHRTAAFLLAAVVVTACGGTSSEPEATTEPSVAPTTEPTTGPSSEPSPTDGETSAGPAVLEQPAVWPAADVAFDAPLAAAQDFVTTALGVPATLGEFRSGDSRSGEVEVFFAGEGGGTQVARGLLLLRQLGPTSSWFVVAAPNDVVTIAEPGQGSEVTAGPVRVAGVARGFEGTVVVTAFVAGDRTAVLDQQITMAGSAAEPLPYEVTLDLSDAAVGDVVAILVQGDTGIETDPGDFAAAAVTIDGAAT